MTNPTGYPVIDGILESIAPRGTADRVAETDLPCLEYEWGCLNYGDDQSRWCSNCKARQANTGGIAIRNSAQARAQLDDQLFNYCYQSIRYSDLWPHLENDTWDALAERLRAQVRTFVEGEIDAELTRIEGAESPSRDSETVET